MRLQLVVAGRHTAKLLETAKQPLNSVALSVAGGVVGPRRATFAPGWNHGLRAAGGQGSYERVGIVAAVGNEVDRGQAVEQGQRLWGVVALTRRQAAAQEPASG